MKKINESDVMKSNKIQPKSYKIRPACDRDNDRDNESNEKVAKKSLLSN